MPFTSVAEMLAVDPRIATVRARLVATASRSEASTAVRYTALSRLELAKPYKDTVGAAEAIASSVAGATEEERWLIVNAVGTLARVRTEEAQRVLAALERSPIAFKRESVTTIRALEDGRAR